MIDQDDYYELLKTKKIQQLKRWPASAEYYKKYRDFRLVGNQSSARVPDVTTFRNVPGKLRTANLRKLNFPVKHVEK